MFKPTLTPKIAQLRLQGKTYREISEETGKASGTIAFHLKKAGLTQRVFQKRRRKNLPVITPTTRNNGTISLVLSNGQSIPLSLIRLALDNAGYQIVEK